MLPLYGVCVRGILNHDMAETVLFIVLIKGSVRKVCLSLIRSVYYDFLHRASRK